MLYICYAQINYYYNCIIDFVIFLQVTLSKDELKDIIVQAKAKLRYR